MLIAMYQRGESANEIAIGAKMMRQYAIDLPIDEELRSKMIDTCGTGGDHSGSFNISTTVALLCSACGAFVAKHGNKSVTSKSGSADVLQALDIAIDLTPEQQVKLLQEVQFAFLFAVNHHPVMQHIMPIRKALPHRTIFNLLGPLAHPAKVSKQFIGVFDQEYSMKMVKALQILGSNEAMIVNSRDGLDEISISDISYYVHLKNGVITQGEIDPQRLGFTYHNITAIKGGDAKYNANIAYGILAGEIQGAMRDIVLLNSAFVLLIEGRVRDIQEALELLNETINSKRAKVHLSKLISLSHKL